MPGVVRAYTLVDVLGTIYSQTSQLSQQLNGSTPSIGIIGEADDAAVVGEAVSGLVTANLGWDQGGWNAITWQ
jgi:hypothetical protein